MLWFEFAQFALNKKYQFLHNFVSETSMFIIICNYLGLWMDTCKLCSRIC